MDAPGDSWQVDFLDLAGLGRSTGGDRVRVRGRCIRGVLPELQGSVVFRLKRLDTRQVGVQGDPGNAEGDRGR